MTKVDMTKAEEEAYVELRTMLAEESWLLKRGESEGMHDEERRDMEYAGHINWKPTHAVKIKGYFDCKKRNDCKMGVRSVMLYIALPPLILGGLRLWERGKNVT